MKTTKKVFICLLSIICIFSTFSNVVKAAGGEYTDQTLTPSAGAYTVGNGEVLTFTYCDIDLRNANNTVITVQAGGKVVFKKTKVHGGSMSRANTGFIVSNGGEIEINDSEFYEITNGAQFSGSPIYATNSKITIKDSNFHDNAGGAGGALYTSRSEIVITDSTFSNNESKNAPNNNPSNRGGALHLLNPKSVSISGSEFEENEASGYGGAIFFRHDEDIDPDLVVDITDCTFSKFN